MFHTIVFSGGANHAATFLGCIRYLEHTCLLKHVRKVVGSSAGSLVALLLALGLTSEEMRTWLFELIEKYAFNKISLDNALDFCESFGIDDGQKIDAAVRATLNKFLPCSTDPTFKDLVQCKGIDFSVCVLNVTKTRYEYMCVDLTPHMSVRTALRMSMSVPLMFAPVVHDNCLYIDPVLGRNFPYDYPGHRENDKGVLGLTVTGEHGKSCGNFSAFLLSLVTILVRKSNEHLHNHSFTMVNMVVDKSIKKFSVDTMEFSWTHEIVSQLSKLGYNELQRALEKSILNSAHADTELDELLHHED